MNGKTEVINLFGGSDSGKEIYAMQLTVALKKAGYTVEYIPDCAEELIKDGKNRFLPGQLDYQEIVAKEQTQRLNRMIGSVDYIITDAPNIMSECYIKEQHPIDFKIRFIQDTISDFNRNPNFCLFIQKENGKEEAKEFDEVIRKVLQKHNINYRLCTSQDIDEITDQILKMAGKDFDIESALRKKENPEDVIKLFEFIKDFDPYEYKDWLEVGETEQQAFLRFKNELWEGDFNNFLDIIEEAMSDPRCTPDEIEHYKSIRSLAESYNSCNNAPKKEEPFTISTSQGMNLDQAIKDITRLICESKDKETFDRIGLYEYGGEFFIHQSTVNYNGPFDDWSLMPILLGDKNSDANKIMICNFHALAWHPEDKEEGNMLRYEYIDKKDMYHEVKSFIDKHVAIYQVVKEAIGDQYIKDSITNPEVKKFISLRNTEMVRSTEEFPIGYGTAVSLSYHKEHEDSSDFEEEFEEECEI